MKQHILCGQLIDGRGDRPLKKSAVLVEGERIVRVGGPDILPKGIEVIDLGGAGTTASAPSSPASSPTSSPSPGTR